MTSSVDAFRFSEALLVTEFLATAYISSTTTCRESRPNDGEAVQSFWPVRAGTMQNLRYGLRRTPFHALG